MDNKTSHQSGFVALWIKVAPLGLCPNEAAHIEGVVLRAFAFYLTEVAYLIELSHNFRKEAKQINQEVGFSTKFDEDPIRSNHKDEEE